MDAGDLGLQERANKAHQRFVRELQQKLAHLVAAIVDQRWERVEEQGLTLEIGEVADRRVKSNAGVELIGIVPERGDHVSGGFHHPKGFIARRRHHLRAHHGRIGQCLLHDHGDAGLIDGQQVKLGAWQGDTGFVQRRHVVVMARRQPVERGRVFEAAIDLDDVV